MDVKYLLMIYTDDATWDALSERERTGVFRGHDEFQRRVRGSGEFVDTAALANRSQATVVRVRDGVVATTDEAYGENEEYLAGYYLVDCESRERAVELAASVPDARFNAMEVRPLMTHGGGEF
jgi:hypothetical protein